MALERPITDTLPHLPSLPYSGHSKRLTKLQTRAPWTSIVSLLPAETRQKLGGGRVPCDFRQTEPNSGENKHNLAAGEGTAPSLSGPTLGWILISQKKIQASLLANPKISRDLSSHQDRHLRPLRTSDQEQLLLPGTLQRQRRCCSFKGPLLYPTSPHPA